MVVREKSDLDPYCLQNRLPTCKNLCIQKEQTTEVVTNGTPGRRQSKTSILSTNVDQKSLETEFFYCHLSPDWRQMAIKNIVSSDF